MNMNDNFGCVLSPVMAITRWLYFLGSQGVQRNLADREEEEEASKGCINRRWCKDMGMATELGDIYESAA